MGPVTDRASRLLGWLAGHGDDLDDLLGTEGGRAAGARGIIEDALDQAELIRRILVDLQLEPAMTVVVGDREHDIIGARANQLRTVGALYGYGTREELLRAGADALCRSSESLREFL